MENQINTLTIENFKSIQFLRMDCKRINLIIGKPNVGKSNILEAISLLSAPYSQNWDRYLSEFVRYEKISNLFFDQNLTKEIHVSSNIGIACMRYHMSQINQFDLILAPDYNLVKKLSNKKSIAGLKQDFNTLLKEEDFPKKPIKPFYASIQPKGSASIEVFDYISPVKKYDFVKLGNSDNRFPLFFLPPDGKNLFTILQSNSELRKKVTSFFREYGLDLVIDIEYTKLEIQKRIDDLVYKLPYTLIADTLQRVIFHLAAIESNTDSVILFEEPEAHSFPPYISYVAEQIVESKENQFFIATHSPYLLNKIIQNSDYDDFAIHIATFNNYQTNIKTLSEEEIKNILDYGIDIFFNLNIFSDEL